MAGALVILGIQNLLYFWRHYFFGVVFPDDFLLTYHAVPYYINEATRFSGEASWIPFQGMGYPTYLNLQSGAFYPLIQLFSLLDITYRLDYAVLLQGFHVFVGAVGALVCARLLGLDWLQSIVAGVLYQSFGGFYSNSQHPDIVRSFSFIPWMCGPVFANWISGSAFLKLSLASLPLWVYAQWTGGYPGSAIASLFLLGAITACRTWFERERMAFGFAIISGLVCGTLMAGIAIVPAMLDANEIQRSVAAGDISYDYLVATDIFSLIFPINNDKFFSHDISMRSLFVGIPALGLFLIGASNWKSRMTWPAICAAIAVLIASGPLHEILRTLVPPLGLSRFVMADYRPFICLGIILVACTAVGKVLDDRKRLLATILLVALMVFGYHLLGAVRDYAVEDERFLILSSLIVVAFLLGKCRIYRLGWTFDPIILMSAIIGLSYGRYIMNLLPGDGAVAFVIGALIITIASIIVSLIFGIWRGRTVEPLVLIGVWLTAMNAYYLFSASRPDRNGLVIPMAIVVTLTIIALSPALAVRAKWMSGALIFFATISNWVTVNWDQRFFAPPFEDGLPWVEKHAGKFSDTRPKLIAALAEEKCRGKRQDRPLPTERAFPWAGYYTGEYYLQDYSGPMKFKRHLLILQSSNAKEFAESEWRMVSAQDGAANPKMNFSTASRVDANCSRYGAARIEVEVNLDKPKLVVENEVYWKGWYATLVCRHCKDGAEEIQVTPVDVGGFRGWRLPAGSYHMVSQFSPPHRHAAMITSGIGVILLIFGCFFILRRL